MPGVNHLAPRGFSWPGAALVVGFLVLWILAETVRRDEGQPQAHRDSLDLAASDFTKSVLSLSIWFVLRQLQGVRSPSSIAVTPYGASETHLETCDVPFHEHGQEFPISRSYPNCREPYPRSTVALTLGNVRSTLAILVVAFVYALRAYTDVRTRQLVDPLTLYLAFPVTVLGILAILRTTSWRNFPSPFWHAAVLQVRDMSPMDVALECQAHYVVSLQDSSLLGMRLLAQRSRPVVWSRSLFAIQYGCLSLTWFMDFTGRPPFISSTL
jgi:hypothetical protein